MMATWIPWLKARTMIEAPMRGSGIVTGVPRALRAQYDLRRQNRFENQLNKKGRKSDPRSGLHRGDPLDLLRQMGDGE